MTTGRRTAALSCLSALTLVLGVSACGASTPPTAASSLSSAQTPVTPATAAPTPSTPSTSATPSGASSTSSALPAGCTSVDPPERAVCRLVTAIRTGDKSGLSAKEKAVAATVKKLPLGPFTQNQCELIGDVTASCTITFTNAIGDNTATFTVVPVNATFNDGTLTTRKGETLRYEVDSYGGLSAG